MYILGIHNSHDASVCLIKDGKIVYYIQEERLNGIKHFGPALPMHALDLCFETQKISQRDLDIIVIPGLHQIKDIKLLFHAQSSEKIDISSNETKFSDKLRAMAVNAAGYFSYLNITDQMDFPVYRPTYPIKSKTRLLQVNHHLSHAASTYYTSGFDECLVVTADGSGDGLSVTAWVGKAGELKPVIKIGRNGSLGFFYNIVTEALGWQISEGEGKTMGLAPYGTTNKTKGVLDFITPVYSDGRLVKPQFFGIFKSWKTDGTFHWHTPQSSKVKKLIDKYGRENIAAEAQRVLEEQMLNFVLPWIKRSGIKKVAAAGGVFLNVKMNQRIWESGLLDDFYIFPDAGDAGLTVGSGLFTNYSVLKNRYIPRRIKNTYWGKEYSDEEIEKILRLRKIKFTKYADKSKLIKDTAMFLAKGKIVAWFQGRMEAGPRALGNRSILMDPRKAENKDIINSRVKFREGFRPFCPSMTPEAAKKYLINPTSADFMIISFDVPKQLVQDIPAVVHVDRTARPQVVTKEANPLYFQLIDEFGKLTGVPVLLNTSFNIKGQPIIEDPQTAIKCFFDTGLDYLAFGNFLLKK
ncbi:MAG: carbamoyltransferase C-terminal domain-containing protein [Candidatus Daviesbacteria bacterium]|nr:carbamoyltransferase C-terminal domain-containing protein [Candidatus Daviesbacteria bacterium]